VGLAAFLEVQQELCQHGWGDLLHGELPQGGQDVLVQAHLIGRAGVFRERSRFCRHEHAGGILRQCLQFRSLQLFQPLLLQFLLPGADLPAGKLILQAGGKLLKFPLGGSGRPPRLRLPGPLNPAAPAGAGLDFVNRLPDLSKSSSEC